MGRSPDLPPIVSRDVRTTRVWVADGQYLEDTTEGTVDGQPYWRRGWLGYSNLDRRYEWVTIAPRVPMMIYLGKPGSGAGLPIEVSGVFTDQGVVNEQTVGKPVGQRTVFRIESDDRHVSELYFTPPGGGSSWRCASCTRASTELRRMRAIVYDPGAPHGLRLGMALDPVPGAHEALVEVHAIALNFGEVAFLAERCKPGQVIGWECAGVVLEAAADGSGPPAGARVAGFGSSGGWAERRAMSVDELAMVPDAIELGVAAAVPVAGVTALRALRALGPVAGRRVLVTGASGGVGRMAVQLAARAGAHVIAAVGRPERGAGLRELGAAEIVVDLAGLAPVYGVVENVGGALLAQAYALLEPDGWLQSVGQASLEPSCIDFERARLRGGGRIEAFNVFSHGGAFGGDLAALLARVERAELDPQVGWRGPWTRLTEALDAFRGRRVQGKAVLDIDGVAPRRSA